MTSSVIGVASSGGCKILYGPQNREVGRINCCGGVGVILLTLGRITVSLFGEFCPNVCKSSV